MFARHKSTWLFVPFLALVMFAAKAIGQEDAPDENAPLSDPAAKLELGVSVTDSPGQGVLVKGVGWGSPAARSGIRVGDFIMAIDDHPIQTPVDVQTQISSAGSEKNVNVSVWRNGETTTMTVVFDARFSDSTREKAWLGVMLETTKGDGVLIADVMWASPAEKGGIQVGDVVLRMNAEKIDTVDELLALMDKIKAGDDVEVIVLRNGQERTFTVRVGSAVQRTMRWFEENVPLEQLERRWREVVPEIQVDPYVESFEGVIDRLQEQMDDLRDEVRRLREGDSEQGNVEEAESDVDETEQGESKSVSTIDKHLPVALANRGNDNRPRRYYNYRGGRPRVRYGPNYYYPRRSYSRGPRYGAAFYYPYGTPGWRYPPYVYPRVPMYYYGPGIRVYYGPVYWY